MVSLAQRPYDFEEIMRVTSLTERRLKCFLSAETEAGFIVEGSAGDFKPVNVPQKIELEVFEGFPSPFLSAPTTVDFFLTRTCNLKCCHCFADGGRPLRNELSFEELVSVFDQLEDMGVLQVRFNGGEPFMRRGIYDVLEYLEDKKFQKLMITNGTLLNEKAIEALARSDIIPTISLDGAKAGVHDAFRGVPGAFERTIKAIKLLKQNGAIFGLNTCVHSKNMGQIEEIIRFGIRLGASRIGLLGLEPVGRMTMTNEYMVSEVEYIFLSLKFLQLAKKFGKEIEVVQEIFPDEVPLKSIGTFTCSIDSDGKVYPTNRILGDSRFLVGDLREKSLGRIWFSRKWKPFRRSLDEKGRLGIMETSWKALARPRQSV
jgi:MoaA/NifB/PqqE/SkfB family radical SAM enzyme